MFHRHPSSEIIWLPLCQAALAGLLRLKCRQGLMAVFQNTWRKRHPLYGRHLGFSLMFSQLFEFGILAALPSIFVGVASWLMWPQLSKPWVFVVSCFVILYMLYGAAFYFAAPTVISMDLIVPANQLQSGAGSTTGELKGESAVWFPFLNAYLRPILLFSVAALPTLWLAVKLCRK